MKPVQLKFLRVFLAIAETMGTVFFEGFSDPNCINICVHPFQLLPCEQESCEAMLKDLEKLKVNRGLLEEQGGVSSCKVVDSVEGNAPRGYVFFLLCFC